MKIWENLGGGKKTVTYKMSVKVIASGSDGNCTALSCNGEVVLLDAGIQFRKIQKALKFKVPRAAFITHEHLDHANPITIKELLRRGVEVVMTAGTCDALNLQPSYNLHIARIGEVCTGLGYWHAMPFLNYHDASEPVSFLIDNHYTKDLAAYIVDTGRIPDEFYHPAYIELLSQITHLLIETNYSKERLRDSPIDERLKMRIWRNHLSVESVVQFLETVLHNMGKLREIRLMHLSKYRGDEEEFLMKIRAAVEHSRLVLLGARSGF